MYNQRHAILALDRYRIVHVVLSTSSMTLRVAFNATPLLSPLTGIGQYIVELSAALTADL